MTSFSHDKKGLEIAHKINKKVQEEYNKLHTVPNKAVIESLNPIAKEAYMIGIDEDNRRLKEQLWSQVSDKKI